MIVTRPSRSLAASRTVGGDQSPTRRGTPWTACERIIARSPRKCRWHQTCFYTWLKPRAVGARSGTEEEHARLNSVRAIGGAEEMKWKKPNEFNSSERRARANSLDLVENGPLY